jgi:hypothetical protein
MNYDEAIVTDYTPCFPPSGASHDQRTCRLLAAQSAGPALCSPARAHLNAIHESILQIRWRTKKTMYFTQRIGIGRQRTHERHLSGRESHRWPKRPAFHFVLVLVLWALSGCQTIGGKVINVEFRSAEGLRGGEAVYLAGIHVGITGEPVLSNGKARVPVTIFRKSKEAIPPRTVFLIKTDSTDSTKLSLVGTACATTSAVQVPVTLYRGASNQIEFLLECASEKAREIWEGFSK